MANEHFKHVSVKTETKELFDKMRKTTGMTGYAFAERIVKLGLKVWKDQYEPQIIEVDLNDMEE